MIKEKKYQRLIVLLNVILLLAVTGSLFTLYYPLEIEQGMILLLFSTLFPLLYFWSLLFPVGRKHVKQLNICFFVILLLWYCIGGIFYNSYVCLIFYFILAFYLLAKKYLLYQKRNIDKVNQIFVFIMILLGGFFMVKISLNYYKIIDSSIPIIVFVITHSLLMITLALHFTMDENHFLEDIQKKKSIKKKS